MKKSILAWGSVFLCVLTSCGSSETYTWAAGDYATRKDAITNDTPLFPLTNATLNVRNIDKKTYQKATYKNVAASRFESAYYSLALSLTASGTVWDSIVLTEIPGSQGMHDNYFFWFDLSLNEKNYPCLFRMILQHYSYLASLKSQEANMAMAMIQEIQWNSSVKTSDYLVLKTFSSFELVYQEK